MTLRIPISKSFGSTTRPRILPDPVVVPEGTLLWWEPGHTAYGTAGVPASGQAFPNLATMFTSLNDSVEHVYEAGAKMWRTTKGGYGLQAPVTANVAPRAQIRFPLDVVQRVLANPTRKYYLSSWVASPTALTLNGRVAELSDATNPNASPYTSIIANPWGTSTPGSLAPAPAIGAVGPHLIANARVGDFSGQRDVASTRANSRIFGTLPYPGNLIPRNSEKAVIYRSYMEDLTASGRTAEAVYALDLAEFTKQTSLGGRYYGDNLASPA